MNTDYVIFRKNIVKIRAVRGMTSRELSECSGLRHSKRIADIEDGRGKPTLDEVCAICKMLGYSIDEMLYKDAKVTVTFEAV